MVVILAAGALLLVQLALIIALLRQRASRLRAEGEVQRVREHLAHLTRVSAMGELAASMAHELNQPLTGILANARAAGHLLARADVPVEQLREIVRDIVEDDKRAAAVIGKLRELARKQPTRHVALDVNELARDVTHLVSSDSIIRRVRVNLNLAPLAVVVEGDHTQLLQVLINLLLNSLESASGCDGGPHAVVLGTHLSDRRTAHVLVRDTGSGLPPGAESRVFEPFFTTKRTGMGMGLAIARSIVESHGGRIWAADAPERGAEFHFTLPRLETRAPRVWVTRQSA